MRGLVLNHEDHSYAFDGKPTVGVSEILTGLNIVDPTYFTDWSRERGRAVHLAIEYHLSGGLDWSSVDERIKGYVEGALKFLDEAKVTDAKVEIPIWHPLLQYAGTPDLVCTAFGEPCIPDWKTGGLYAAGMATALYEMAARIAYPLSKATGRQTRRRMGVQLFPEGRYKKRDLDDGFDYSDATSAVTLYRKHVYPRTKGAHRVAA